MEETEGCGVQGCARQTNESRWTIKLELKDIKSLSLTAMGDRKEELMAGEGQGSRRPTVTQR